MGRRTQKGIELEMKPQKTYEKWWLGKRLAEPVYINNELYYPTIIEVKYIGNSVYGIVKIKLDTGDTRFVPQNSYRPKKSNLKLKQGD